MQVNEKKLDWHLFWGAAGVVSTIVIVIISCHISILKSIAEIKQEIVKIQTVLIIKQIAPPELFSTGQGEEI